jgi:hypothetical protein
MQTINQRMQNEKKRNYCRYDRLVELFAQRG